ncbi:MAG TPA: ABC transporter permease [Bauldia sp.]|nr:ABC transporter permease [Bauldia sp.]
MSLRSGVIPIGAGEDDRSPTYRVVTTVLAYALPLVFIVLPLGLFLLQSFFYVDRGTEVHELTLRNYVRFFSDAAFVPVFLRTCLVCVAVAAISVIFAYPIAYLLASLEGRRKYVLALVFVIPLMMSYIIKIYAIRAILGGNGFLNRILVFVGIVDQPLDFLIFNLQAVTLTLSVLLLPFAILPIFIALERIPRNILDASADLGASSWQTFRRVIWPLSLQGTIVAATFTFVLALGDFVTPQMVGGTSGMTFGRIIYTQFGFAFNWPFGAALSVILLVLVLAVLLLTSLFGRARHQL